MAERPECDPRLFEEVPIGQVARELGVSARTIQRWVSRSEPRMPHSVRGRKVYVAPLVAYEHLKEHANVRGLREPAGYVSGEQAVAALAEQAEVIAKDMGGNPREFLMSFLTGDRTDSAAMINAYANVVGTLTRAAEVEARNKRRYDLRDLLHAVEDVRDLYISGMDAMTARASMKLKHLLADYFGVKLSGFANAQAILQNCLVDELEEMVVWFRGQVKEQIEEMEAKDT